MKKVFVTLVVLVAALFVSASASYGQGKAKTGPDPSTIRDAELEKDSLHNLEVARHYFKLKKAYVAALKRCEEIDAGNPNFARMDEVLYIAGESSLRLAENQQKTKESAMQKKRRKKPRRNSGKMRVSIFRGWWPVTRTALFLSRRRPTCKRWAVLSSQKAARSSSRQ